MKLAVLAGLSAFATAAERPLFNNDLPFHPQVGQLLSLFAADSLGSPNELDGAAIEDLKQGEVPCNYFYNNAWYNLGTLGDDNPEIYMTSSTTSLKEYAAFTFCKKLSDFPDQITANTVQQPGKITCEDEQAFSAYALHTNPTVKTPSCQDLSTSALTSVSQSTYTDPAGAEHLAIHYSSGTCSLQVGLICPSESQDGVTYGPLTRSGECDYQTTMTGDMACATVDLNALWDFLSAYDWLWGAGMIIIGALVCFFGRKLFVICLFIATAVIVCFAIMLLFYTTFLKSDTEDWVGWVVLSCAVLIGLCAGFFMTKLQKVGAGILAGWGGFMLGMLINEMALYQIGSDVVFWIVCISCALIAGLLTICLFDHVLIIMTAFAGAYSFWRGVSMYAGGFPNEFTLAEELENGSIEAISGWFYAYMVAIILTCGLGAFVQYKKHDANTSDNPYQALN